MAEKWSWTAVSELLPLLLEGAKTTVIITIAGFLVAGLFGLLFAMLRRSPSKIVSKASGVVIDFIRCTPLLVQAFFLYFALPEIIHVRIDKYAAGIAALGLHYATYLSEVYRAGIDNVPKGQWEASRALNFGKAQTWLRIVLPQAIPPIVPVMGNYFIMMFKETPILIVIALPEMLLQAKLYGSANFRYIEAYTMVGLIFLLLSLPSSYLFRRLETKLNRR
ncbi:ectoine/hydroxyectoine ABC transporter permease subunit EhuD [Paenibacillus antri]|uniref:Ectoine/hydroxyectoine ABC transporter permease subunit EhuD n=1 Tax=Paenibacillus antri TaxID=2582848 RepID=A0A5R9G7Z7_9BACL|nr:ectoine/hydroxyectoine ABC transporter permease subunit EhuD [Paenibacillus antri]TLS50200.1 ectoine/hydroxyectoine ABC transporter permease subunit EhuD [Paenibacillus antri]